MGTLEEGLAEELKHWEIEFIRHNYCEACKGRTFLHETRCYERCEGFASEIKNMRMEMFEEELKEKEERSG